jgi:hypothetical protein
MVVSHVVVWLGGAKPFASAPTTRWRAGGIAAVIDDAGRIGLRRQP